MAPYPFSANGPVVLIDIGVLLQIVGCMQINLIPAFSANVCNRPLTYSVLYYFQSHAGLKDMITSAAPKYRSR